MDPEYAYAHCLLGDVMRERGDYEGAIALYQRYLEAYPSETWAHARIGALKLLLDRPQDVAGHMAAALKLSPLETNLIAFAQVRAGFAESQVGRADSAYLRFRDAAAAWPHIPTPRLAMRRAGVPQ